MSRNYLAARGAAADPAALAFFSGLDVVASVDPTVAANTVQELVDQRANIKLIASENYASLAVQLAQGNLLTDKYAEGIAGRRFYAGCDNVDRIESLGAGYARELFGADHAYIQPHSGADANIVAFLAILAERVESRLLEKFAHKNAAEFTPTEWGQLRAELHEQRLLGMDYYSGGHLTHGYRLNVSSRLFDAHQYTVDRETKLIDLDALHRQLHEVRPLILLAGYSAYSRLIDFARLREMADEVGAVLMVDMAHFSGLVAGKVFTGDHNPVAHAHVVTSTTHKTLRGPRGGFVLSTAEFADAVDKGCPSILGGPLPHVMAAKTVAFREALEPAFADYAARIVENARRLAERLVEQGLPVLTGGTDNHLIVADLTTFGLSGRQAEAALRSIGLTLNRNALPFDPNGPWYTTGLRLGTAAITTLGMGADEVDEIADVVISTLRATKVRGVEGTGRPSRAQFEIEAGAAQAARARVADLLSRFPVYPEIDLDAAGWPAGNVTEN
ncbi:serine hydroxymethyltransferase [Frankia sp. R43]|nr:serine hydroxymethyltransferase [Frankia sp. R43]